MVAELMPQRGTKQTQEKMTPSQFPVTRVGCLNSEPHCIGSQDFIFLFLAVLCNMKGNRRSCPTEIILRVKRVSRGQGPLRSQTLWLQSLLKAKCTAEMQITRQGHFLAFPRVVLAGGYRVTLVWKDIRS